MIVETEERNERRRLDVDRDGSRVVQEVEEVIRGGQLPLLMLFLSLGGVLVVERDDVVFLGEGPPPLESLPPTQAELGLLPLQLQLGDELDDVREGPGGPPVVRHVGDLAAELQHGHLLGLGEPDLVEDLHPLGLAEDVVVESPLGYPVPGAGLGEPQPLGDHGLDGVLQL